MSFEDRIRQSFAAAIEEARGKLDAELSSTLASVREESAREREAAVAEARSAVEAELVSSHDRTLLDLRHEAESTLAAARHDADAALETARAAAERDQMEIGRLLQETEAQAAALRDADAARLQAAEALAGSSRRLLDGVKALDDGSSLSEVLDALTAATAAEAGRAAMLVVKGNRELLGWRTAGYGELDAQPRSIESSTSDADALARAVATGRPVVTGSGPASSVPSFAAGDAGRNGIAVPLLVGGRTVAVLYADTPADGGEASQRAIEVLVRHAGRCLEALTVQRAAQARTSAVRVSTPVMPAARPTRPGQRARIAGLAGVAAVVVALGADALRASRRPRRGFRARPQ